MWAHIVASLSWTTKPLENCMFAQIVVFFSLFVCEFLRPEFMDADWEWMGHVFLETTHTQRLFTFHAGFFASSIRSFESIHRSSYGKKGKNYYAFFGLLNSSIDSMWLHIGPKVYVLRNFRICIYIDCCRYIYYFTFHMMRFLHLHRRLSASYQIGRLMWIFASWPK